MLSHSQEYLQHKPNTRYNPLPSYMGYNKLKLNDDKTHLLIMTTKQKRRILNVDIKVDTPTEEIGHIKCERLLGVCIQDDLKWSSYILHD